MTTTNELDVEQPAAPAPPVRMSYEEYMQWEHEGSLAEWVDGEVIVHMPVTYDHQKIVDFLNRLLGLFVQLRKLGVVRSAPYAMRAAQDGPTREPDLLFVLEEHRERLTQRRLDGPADLVVEVILTESVARDRDEKFFEYQAAGVPEYWIIDPRATRQRADFFVLDQNRIY